LYFTFAEKSLKVRLQQLERENFHPMKPKIENFQVIFRAVPYFDNSMHFGSRIVFDKNGNIFVSTGERSDLATRP